MSLYFLFLIIFGIEKCPLNEKTCFTVEASYILKEYSVSFLVEISGIEPLTS